MSVHQVRKVLFVLRPADATNGEFKLLSYLAWDARHDGRRFRTTVRRLKERSGFTYDTVRNALVEFEHRGWLALRRGPRGRIVDWRLTLPAKLELGEACGKPCGKAVGQLRLSPRDSSVADRVHTIEGSREHDPTVEKTAVSAGANEASPRDPSLDPSLDPSQEGEEAPRRGAPLTGNLHFENADSKRQAPPDIDHEAGREQLRLTLAKLRASTPADPHRRRSRA